MTIIITFILAILISATLGFLFGVGWVKHMADQAAKNLAKSAEKLERAAEFYKAAEAIERKRHEEFERMDRELRDLMT